ncbi:MAG: hypothetical protein ABW061_10215 [Polyangiaceae bacterium]
MWSFNRVLFVSCVLCAQSLLACGGSSVGSHGNPDTGDGDGAGDASSSGGRDSGSGNGGSHAAGRGPQSAGAPSAGGSASSGSSEHGSAGAANPGPNGTKLSEIKTDAQALALCEQIRGSISDRDLEQMHSGSCAISGQTGEASQLGTCEELQAECATHSPAPSPNDGSCTADDIPDCDNVTVDEYVACTRATITLGVAYLSSITCDTDLRSLEEPGTAAACAEPFARCPEYAAKYQ